MKLKNNNEKKKVKSKMTDEEKKVRLFKIFKIIFIVAICIIIIELFVMVIMHFINESKINYLDTIYDASLVEDNYYIAAGSSNFKNSRFNNKKTYKLYSDEAKKEYRKVITEQAKLVKYDMDKKVIWEKTFATEYDSTFYDAVNVSDGFIAVGSYIYEYDQIELRVRDGLIVKYDSDGNYKWHKNYQILGDTEFYKVIDVNDGIIAIGQSIYENMQLGNHTTGGGIIVKYDYDGNIVWKNNFGGNKSGSFNDIVVTDDGYIVCGKDGANYGLIAKFDKEGKIKWHYSTYKLAVTDNLGFNAIKLYDNKLYIASSINYSDEKNEKGDPIYKFKGCIYVYDLNGKCLKKYRSDSTESFTDLIIDNNGITAIGITNEKNDKYDNQTAVITKFDLEGNELIKDYYGGLNNDVLTTIIDNNNEYMVFGYSNSFGNKKDYNVIFQNIEKDSNVIFSKN